MPRLAVRLLGRPSLEIDGAPWTLELPPRYWTLLALLSLAPRGEPAKRSAIARALFPDDHQPEAYSQLRRHLYRIIRALPPAGDVPWLDAGKLTAGWHPAAGVWIDLHAFLECAADPKRYGEAVEYYRGDLLEGSYDECVFAHRERMRRTYLDICREAASIALRRREFPEAERFADRMLSADEWNEEALRLGMSIRYDAGDRSSALAGFEQFAQRLKREMGVDPTSETLALRDAILANVALRSPAHDGADEPDGDAASVDSAPFVGRETERETLDAAWRAAARGRGTVAFIGGEAGIGKSRLVAEFARSVRAQGGRVFVGQTSQPEAYPYEPIVDALRGNLPALIESPAGEPWQSALAEVLPELHAAFPQMSAAEPLDPQKARTRLFEAFARSVDRAARARPLLLVLEDLHWAQPATLDAVEALAQRIASAPVLAIVTHRTGEGKANEALARLRRSLGLRRLATSFDVAPLQRQDLESFVHACVRSDLPDPIVAEISQRSGGNALFAWQLAAGYAEAGVLPGSDARGDGIVAAVLSRVATLDSPSRALLEAAAVAGSSVTTEMLADVMGWSEDEALNALRASVDRRFLRASGSSALEYAFTHATIASSVYEAMAPAERAVRHRRIAAVTSQAGAGGTRELAAIARHWELGGERERARRAYGAAAQAAITVYASAEAVSLARAALALTTDPAQRYDLLLTACRAQHNTFDHAPWERDLRALEACSAEMGPRQRFAAMHQWSRYFTRAGRMADQAVAIARMQQLAGDAGDEDLRAQANFELGVSTFNQGRFADAIAPLQEAVPGLRACADRPALAQALGFLARAHQHLGDSEGARRYLNECGDVARADDSLPVLRHYVHAQGDIAFVLQDVAMAKRTGESLLGLATRAGDGYLELDAHTSLAFSAQAAGSAAEVRHHLKRSIEISKDLPDRSSAVGVANLAQFELSLGHAQRALDGIAGLRPLIERENMLFLIARMESAGSQALALLGDLPAALAQATAAHERTAEFGNASTIFAECAVSLANVLRLRGESERALDVLAKVSASVPEVSRIGVLRARALALADLDRSDELLPVVEELARLFAARETSPEPTLTLYALARAATASGDAAAGARYAARGRALVERERARFADENSSAAFAALPHNRALLGWF